MDSVFVDMLVRDGVLLSDQQKNCPARNCNLHNLWRNNKAKRRVLNSDAELRALLLRNYAPSGLDSSNTVQANFFFPNRTIGFLGSQIIRNGQIDSLRNARIPYLPVLASNNQLSILDPNATNYKLNFTTSSAFKGDAAIEAAVEKNPYASGKAGMLTTRNEQNLQTINIGVGEFRNQLAKAIDDMASNDFDPKHFNPIYYIWTGYKAGQIQSGDACINSFTGLCFSNQRISSLETNAQFTAQVEAAVTVPFLSASANAHTDWTKKNASSSQSNEYFVFMFTRPDLRTFPTVTEIKDLWKKLARRAAEKEASFENGNTIPYNSNLPVTILFGPVPGEEIAQNIITVDTAHTFRAIGRNHMINDITIDPANIKPTDQPNFYSIRLILHRNKDFFNSVTTANCCNLEVPLRVYLNNPIGQDTLAVVYKSISLAGEAKPLPYLAGVQPIKSRAKDRSKYLYSTQVHIDPPSGAASFSLITTGANKPAVIDIANIERGRSDLKTRLRQSCVTESSTQLNSFQLSFAIDSARFDDYLESGNELDFVLQFRDAQHPAGAPFTKHLVVKIDVPDEIAAAKANRANPVVGSISFNTNQELLNAIDTSFMTKEGKTLGELLAAFESGTGAKNNLGLIEVIKAHTDLILSPENKYILSTRFVKKEKQPL